MPHDRASSGGGAYSEREFGKALSQRHIVRFSCHALRRRPTTVFEVVVLRSCGPERGAALALTPFNCVESAPISWTG